MNLSAINFSSKYNIFKKESIHRLDLPFIKIILAGKKGEAIHIISKVNKSKNYINYHLEKLLLKGFNGTKEDFDRVYGNNQTAKKMKSKGKIKLNNSLLLKSDLLYKPMQKTIIKEFNFVNKPKDKIINMKPLLNTLKKNNISQNTLEINKKILFRNNSAYDVSGQIISSPISDFYKTSVNIKNTKNNSIYNNSKGKSLKIKKIRKLLNEKSRNMLNESAKNIDFQNSTFETIKQNIEKENKNEQKKINLDRLEVIKQIILKTEKKKKEKKDNSEIINKTFRLLLNKKEDDKEKFKKVLDPLSKGFKGQLKEIQKNEGRERHHFWIKRSTANLVSFGNSFQLMADEEFYRARKRIVSKYPDIERQANIIVPPKIEKIDNKIMIKMENNERKIRNILNDNKTLLKNIKEKYIEIKQRNASNSQPSIKKKKK